MNPFHKRRFIFALVLGAGLVAGPRAEASLVTFDFTTEPLPGQSNGLTELPLQGFPPRATFTGEFGRQISIVTNLAGGSTRGYFLDTIGSGPTVADTLWGQRALFFYGADSGPLVQFGFGSAVKLVSATFVLYATDQNLEIVVEHAADPRSTHFQYFFTGGPDPSNPPSPLGVPPETTVLFDNTVPFADGLRMRSLGVSGAALKTLVIDDPAVTPVPEPAATAMLLGAALMGLAGARRRWS